jgi:peroxiredoxin
VRSPEARLNEAKSLDQALAEAFSKADHLQAPLDQRLKLYLGESRKLLPEMEATYDQLHSLARAYPDIVAAGGDVISIVPETARYARALQAARGVPFRVLTDIDLGYALNLGLIFWVGDKIMDMYRGFGIDLAHFQGNGGWFLPVPATLVVGRDGRVMARFVDPDFRHRMCTEDIVEAVGKAAQA